MDRRHTGRQSRLAAVKENDEAQVTDSETRRHLVNLRAGLRHAVAADHFEQLAAELDKTKRELAEETQTANRLLNRADLAERALRHYELSLADTAERAETAEKRLAKIEETLEGLATPGLTTTLVVGEIRVSRYGVARTYAFSDGASIIDALIKTRRESEGGGA
jgi:hypothetical protein